jgi:hypothetical protein
MKEKGEVMAKDATSPIQSIIDAFKWRAFRRQLGAYGFLGLMLAGIGVAAWVFWQAKEITASDTNTDLNGRISSLKKMINDNSLKIQETWKPLSSAYLTLLRELPTVTKENCKLPIKELDTDFFSFLDRDGRLRSKSEMAQELYRASLNMDTDCISISAFQAQVIFNVKQLGEAKLQNWDNITEASTVSTLHPEINKLNHLAQVFEKSMKKLLDIQEQQEEAPFVGDTATQQTPLTLTLPFLLQLNITRFGTITLVVIGLSILAPLYRFSARLATFYRARADILILHQIPGYKQISMTRLSPIFTPAFDFGKSQAMPDHLTELIRAALAHGKDTE